MSVSSWPAIETEVSTSLDNLCCIAALAIVLILVCDVEVTELSTNKQHTLSLPQLLEIQKRLTSGSWNI